MARNKKTDSITTIETEVEDNSVEETPADEEATPHNEGWSVVNTRPADISLNGNGLSVLVPGALTHDDGTVVREGTATLPAALVAALYDSNYFRSLFKDGTLRKV